MNQRQYFGLPSTRISRWFRQRYGKPTPAQQAAWPLVAAGRNVLIASPTGTGKTFAAFLGVLNALADEQERGVLGEGIQAVYVSPLRALTYDLEKNLKGPLREAYGGEPPIRIGLRTGDTPAVERARQASRPPHLLLTTPESLMILLSQPRWVPALQRVRWVIVDELHALAENKRGAHLSLSLERLECLGTEAERPFRLQRLGLSATIAPLEEMARYLAGEGRPCEIVDAIAGKRVVLEVYSPLRGGPYPAAGFTGVRLIRELSRLIRGHATTLIFSNTRSGAESMAYGLREALPELAERIACHHASLDRDLRLEVEDRLKQGDLRAVVCSTSLELGIDVGSIDLVVMLAAPKGVSRALQRTGRAGHHLRQTSRGLLLATNLNDLVECCATARLARRRHLDAVRLPDSPLDVLAQHLVGMGCLRRWRRVEALSLVRRAHVYRRLAGSEFDEVLEFLAGGGHCLRRQYTEVFGKIDLDDDTFETRPGAVRRDFLQNAGVIPNEGVVSVRLRGRTLGTVEESFARGLRPEDVFTLEGRPVRVRRIGVMELFVERAEGGIPTVPRWNASKMPLSNRVAEEILAFREELRARLEGGDPASPGHRRWIAERLECGDTNAGIVHRVHLAQMTYSEIPTGRPLLIEEFAADDRSFDLSGAGEKGEAGARQRRRARGKGWKAGRAAGGGGDPAAAPARHYFFHSLIGRAANDALARAVAFRLARLRGGNAVATPDDYGFVLTVRAEQAIHEDDLEALLSPRDFASDVQASLTHSELLKYHFRNAAQTGLMVYRNYFGRQKAVRKLQWSTEVILRVLLQHEPGHVLLREARREATHDFLDLPGALAFLERRVDGATRLRRVWRVPPLSFGMYASRIREALLVEDPRETMERLFRLWWGQLDPAGSGTGGE